MKITPIDSQGVAFLEVWSYWSTYGFVDGSVSQWVDFEFLELSHTMSAVGHDGFYHYYVN